MLEWYYLAILSALSMAASTLIEKYALKKEHATQYSASFSLIAFLFSLVMLPFVSLSEISIYALVLIYVCSLFAAWNLLLMARLYRHSSVSMTTPTSSALPNIFIVLIAIPFLNENLRLYQYACIVILVLATYMMFISGKKSIWGKVKASYIPLLILASLSSAVSWAIAKYVVDIGISPFTFTVLLAFFIALNMAVFMQMRFGGFKEIVGMIRRYPSAIISSSVLTVVSRMIFFFALIGAEVSIALPLRSAVGIILTVLFGSIIFKEGSLARRIILSLVMVAASYVLIL